MTTDDLIRQIAWEKWKDPYGENIDQVEWPGAFGNFETDKLIEKENNKNDEDEDDEWNEDKYESKTKTKPSISKFSMQPMKILATPVGVIPMTEWSCPSKIFNFWVIHSNFRINTEIQNILDDTDGVETLDIFSPYRWRIGIGKAFNENETKQNIMKNLNAIPLQTGEKK